MRFRKALWSAVTIAALASGGSADEPLLPEEAARSALLSAKTVRCSFNEGTTSTWDNGELSTVKSTWTAGPLIYDSIDLSVGRARAIGNVGATDVTAKSNFSSVTFVSAAEMGTNFTTVYAKRAPDGHLIAVLSRHHFNRGPYSSQYHGTCELLD